MLNIKPTDRVLEIGSGNRPRKRSDVLCDKYLDDNVHRGEGTNLVLDKRPFVVADGMALPFKDKSFDYVILSHVIEHVDDPHKFAAELERIAKGGYIETPSELGEKVFGWQFHTWILRMEGDTLVLRRRTEDSPFGKYFHDMYAKDLVFAEFVDSHYSDFYVQYEWSGKIKLSIEDDLDTKVKPHKDHSPTDPEGKRKAIATTGLHWVLRPFLFLLRHFRKVG